MSKLTNLKKGVVGVCAATMLTGLCAVPAFAASDTVDTTVKLNTSDVAQITVTVPTSDLTGVVDSKGKMTFASNYNFTNTGLLGVKISNLEVKVDPAMTAVKLVDGAVFAGESAGDNALNLTATIGDAAAAVDLSDFVAAGGAAISDNTIIGTTPVNVKLDGQMKNFTAAGVMGETAFATLTWTVTTA